MEIHRAAYRWTSEELATAWRRHRDTELRPSMARLVGAFAFLLSAAILATIFFVSPPAGASEGFPFSLMAIPAFSIYWTLLRQKALAWQARRGFEKLPGADVLVEWEFSPQELKVYQRDLSYSAVAWKSFVKVVEVRDGFLLYTHPRIFHWLPFRAFETPAAIEKTREFVQGSGVPYQKIAR